MPELPADLQSDTGTERLASRSIPAPELASRQVDRIGYLRSAGHAWGPAVEHLRSLLVGLEDAQFWDGMPPEARKAVATLEADPQDKKALATARRIRRQWEPYGWRGLPIRALPPGPDGRVRYRPTADNLADMLEVLMQLMARRGISWKHRTLSPLPPVPGGLNGEADD